MIKFLQNYTTTALPPERFEQDQEVSGRSEESELYFVRLGVAGYVVDGVLVDQDYKPIVLTQTVAVVETPRDRRFASGRGGEMLGLDAPQRASTGPGNVAVFGDANAVGEGPSWVEFDQLTSDLAGSASQFEEHRTASATQIDGLTTDLTAAQGAREAALADLAKAQSELSDLRQANQKLQSDNAALAADRDAVKAEREDLTAKLAASGQTPTKPKTSK
jgi:hypothetical protein